MAVKRHVHGCCAAADDTLVLASGQTDLKAAVGGAVFSGTSAGLETCASTPDDNQCVAPVAVLKVRVNACNVQRSHGQQSQ
jgi:hypothetical protein